MPTLQALVGLAFFFLLWAGGRGGVSGRITIGNFVMFNTYMGMLVWPMIALGWVVNLTQRGTASMARIDDLMQHRPSIAAPSNPVPLTEAVGDIEFRDVVVEFPGGRRAV